MMAPCWPGVLRQRGIDELLPVRDAEHWTSDVDFRHWRPHDGDCVIDSTGIVFDAVLPVSACPPAIAPRCDGYRMSLGEFSELVRRHLSMAGQCCVSKIELASFAEGIALVAQAAG